VSYAATYGPVGVAGLVAGGFISVDVPVTNAGAMSWTNDAATGAVNLSYHWYTLDYSLLAWDGVRTPIGATVLPGQSRTISALVRAPARAGMYALAFDLVREGIAWFGIPLRVDVTVTAPIDAAVYTPSAGAATGPDQHVALPTVVMNVGTTAWSSSGATPVLMAYHLYDASGNLLRWDGLRTALGADVPPGTSRAVRVDVLAPHSPGGYIVRVDLVREGVAWFSSRGSPAPVTPLRVTAMFGASYAADSLPTGGAAATTVTDTIAITNTGATTWPASGTAPVLLSYHITTDSGQLVVWDGARSALPRAVLPGETVTVAAAIQVPATPGTYTVAWDAVQEGVTWFSSLGSPPLRRALIALPASLVGAEWSRVPTTSKVVALTFDCGGNDAGVARILAALASANARATFFVTGRWAEVYRSSVAAIAARYPIGDHTYSHPHLTQLDDAAVAAEIAAGERSLAASGVDSHPLFRFPYGESDQRTMAIANRAGYGGIRWTVDTLAWEGASNGQSSDSVLARVLASLQPGEIVLMHVGSAEDGTTLDADALPRVIAEIRARGYELITLRDALW
jgi:peptidoglycan/xylan/chitin deacetylase (PgdA/CDA1 family)